MSRLQFGGSLSGGIEPLRCKLAQLSYVAYKIAQRRDEQCEESCHSGRVHHRSVSVVLPTVVLQETLTQPKPMQDARAGGAMQVHLGEARMATLKAVQGQLSMTQPSRSSIFNFGRMSLLSVLIVNNHLTQSLFFAARRLG